MFFLSFLPPVNRDESGYFTSSPITLFHPSLFLALSLQLASPSALSLFMQFSHLSCGLPLFPHTFSLSASVPQISLAISPRLSRLYVLLICSKICLLQSQFLSSNISSSDSALYFLHLCSYTCILCRHVPLIVVTLHVLSIFTSP